jgi:hypothetical protein
VQAASLHSQVAAAESELHAISAEGDVEAQRLAAAQARLERTTASLTTAQERLSALQVCVWV